MLSLRIGAIMQDGIHRKEVISLKLTYTVKFDNLMIRHTIFSVSV